MKINAAILPDNLLAKSLPNDGQLRDGCFLFTHTIDVVEAVEAILDTIENDLQRFFKLSETQMPSLRATARLAAFCHDLGKANDGFQAMITKMRKDQAIRHEHLSTLLMSLPEVKTWLGNLTDADYELARLVVLGHHLKAVDYDNIETKGRNVPIFARSQNQNDETHVVLYSEHSQFKKLLGETILTKPDFKLPTDWSFYDENAEVCIASMREQIINELESLQVKLKKDEPRRRLLWATKAVFFAADAVASGLRRKESDVSANGEDKATIKDWIEYLGRGKDADDIGGILEKRKAEVIKRKLAKENIITEFKPKDFQREAATLGERALLLAPCGSGKTIAAYLWIQKQLEIHPGWKVVFLYPTTGTATEGFKDYASHDEDSALVHSRAAFDLEGMFENPDDKRNKNDYTVDQRLYALGYWPDSIFSATADAFLSFLQNNYSSLCLLPVLARSVIVIDEIHSFDYAMFDALIEFLKQFNAPVLLMTASLQRARIETLKREFPKMKLYPQESDMARLEELQASADFKRYCIKYKSDWPDKDKTPYPLGLAEVARKAYDEGLKVLWVVNTVDRCIQIARELNKENVLCYHSRFMYCDRIVRHREVVSAFQDTKNCGVIAVTTQVCEMSLDLDADILITELAPAPSLIQRMGRCNRSIEGREPEKHGRVYVYDPTDTNPYGSEAIHSGSDLLASLDLTEAVKQSQLASALESVAVDKERGKRCLFTMSMWEAYSGNDFRATDDYTVSAVLESRLVEFKRLQRNRDSKSAGLILQAPRRLCMKDKPEGMWLAVVPDMKNSQKIKYCAKYGLREE